MSLSESPIAWGAASRITNRRGVARNQPINPTQNPLASAFISRTNAEISRRRATAAAVKRPCLRRSYFPLGPGDIPRCIGDGGSLVIGRRLLEERPRF